MTCPAASVLAQHDQMARAQDEKRHDEWRIEIKAGEKFAR
jgi:hypothetical protein